MISNDRHLCPSFFNIATVMKWHCCQLVNGHTVTLLFLIVKCCGKTDENVPLWHASLLSPSDCSSSTLATTASFLTCILVTQVVHASLSPTQWCSVWCADKRARTHWDQALCVFDWVVVDRKVGSWKNGKLARAHIVIQNLFCPHIQIHLTQFSRFLELNWVHIVCEVFQTLNFSKLMCSITAEPVGTGSKHPWFDCIWWKWQKTFCVINCTTSMIWLHMSIWEAAPPLSLLLVPEHWPNFIRVISLTQHAWKVMICSTIMCHARFWDGTQTELHNKNGKSVNNIFTWNCIPLLSGSSVSRWENWTLSFCVCDLVWRFSLSLAILLFLFQNCIWNWF